MPKPIIKVENLSKQYRLGNIGTGTIREDVQRWWHMIRGKEDPFLKIGETNNRSIKSNGEYVWVLKDVNFEVMQGEILGIIGKNGAGKSTLLKILSKVTGPTKGSISYNGRIGSLLEVGTGFHPDLNGRENIFLNGSILGMTKQEIRSKLDEIIDFSGCERYIDTPIKRYSSGMTVRLGFAIAANFDPEILVVDEVLAVGDAEFQKKAIGKMKDVSQNEGRTVLFVSHNMGAVKSLCTSGILLQHGELALKGSIDKVIETYLIGNEKIVKNKIQNSKLRQGSGRVIFSDFRIENSRGKTISSITTGGDLTFVFEIKLNCKDCKNINIGFSLHDVYDDTLSILYSSYQSFFINPADSSNDYIEVKCTIKKINLGVMHVNIYGRIIENGIEADWLKIPLGKFDVEIGDFYKTGQPFRGNDVKLLLSGEWKA